MEREKGLLCWKIIARRHTLEIQKEGHSLLFPLCIHPFALTFFSFLSFESPLVVSTLSFYSLIPFASYLYFLFSLFTVPSIYLFLSPFGVNRGDVRGSCCTATYAKQKKNTVWSGQCWNLVAFLPYSFIHVLVQSKGWS